MPEVGYCRDCKWWRSPASQLWGDCQLTVRHYVGDMITTESFPTLAVAALKKQYPRHVTVQTVLETMPLFGCLQFQARFPKESPHD